MNSSLRTEIEKRLSQYLAGQSTLAEFHNWYIPIVWDIDAEPEGVKRFAHRLQLFLAEFSNGDRTEDELRSAFWDVLNRNVTVIVGTTPSIVAGTDNVTQAVGTVPGMPVVGTLPAAVSA